MRITNRFGPIAAASLLGIAAAFAFIDTGWADEAPARPEAAVSPMQRVTDARAKAAAENPDGADRVYGGNQAEKGAYPFQVALLTTARLDENPASQANAQFCGGSLIANRRSTMISACCGLPSRPMRRPSSSPTRRPQTPARPPSPAGARCRTERSRPR